MASIRKKTRKAREFAEFVLELGYIPTVPEYRAMSGVPLRWATLKRLYGNWNRFMRFLPQVHPELWEKMQALGPESEPAQNDVQPDDLAQKMADALKSKTVEGAVEGE